MEPGSGVFSAEDIKYGVRVTRVSFPIYQMHARCRNWNGETLQWPLAGHQEDSRVHSPATHMCLSTDDYCHFVLKRVSRSINDFSQLIIFHWGKTMYNVQVRNVENVMYLAIWPPKIEVYIQTLTPHHRSSHLYFVYCLPRFRSFTESHILAIRPCIKA